MKGILDTLERPEDLRALSPGDLPRLAHELRTRIIDTVSRNGGHLGANLGVVELTIALLRAFEPATDRIVWDTSHQTYAWKLLTGRRDAFSSLRQYEGLSGFTRRDESPCDAFGAGHAGTALSAALGLAAARDRRGGREHVVAVVGDAAIGNGISLEALNNVADTTERLIVVLNDNEMSIGGTVGSLAHYFGKLLASPHYNRWKARVERTALRLRLRRLRGPYHRIEEAVKSLLLENAFFEEFGLRYIGPVDGHDMPLIEAALSIARHETRPILLHVNTVKGRGYAPAEVAPASWHGTCAFDVATGERAATGTTWSSAFGDSLVRIAESDPRVCAVTAAMCANTGLSLFAERFPDRLHDVGICEAHAVTYAAGLAAGGERPVVAVYSSFMQRAVDGVLHDICLQKLPVVLCLDRAGLVGDDGPTHHGLFDIPMLRCIPDLCLMQPRDKVELDAMLNAAFEWDLPVAMRYPRGVTPESDGDEAREPVLPGRAEVLDASPGAKLGIWALGDWVPLARDVARMLAEAGTCAEVVNARFIKPLDTTLLKRQVADGARLIVTLENGVTSGGFGSAVQEALMEAGLPVPVLRVGWPDRFVSHGAPERLMADCGLTPESIVLRIQVRLEGAVA